MEYYIAMKMNRLSLHVATWIYLMNIIKLCKKEQASKSTYYTISTYEMCKWANSIHAERGQNRVATSGGTVTRRVQVGSWMLAMPYFSIRWCFHGWVHSAQLHLAV